jgi:peptidoglycan hydrolase CwlO-like protein
MQIALSATGAIIFIVALLLVAAIIGYVTAWFYAKSIYTPIIKQLESEKADLIKQVAGLKADVEKLNEKIEMLNRDIIKLEKDLSEKDMLIDERDKQINELKKRDK